VLEELVLLEPDDVPLFVVEDGVVPELDEPAAFASWTTSAPTPLTPATIMPSVRRDSRLAPWARTLPGRGILGGFGAAAMTLLCHAGLKTL
jgi:hypothetical protein